MPNLLFRARAVAGAAGLVNKVTAPDAGWSLLSVELRRFTRGETWSFDTRSQEAALVVLGGRCAVSSDRGEWLSIGRRRDPFDGLPWALYLPRGTKAELTALGDLEVALALAPTDRDHSPALISPDKVSIETRGGRNNTRQINNIIAPGFDCHRLVACEVYTPSGNWSSYPPHKHDEHRVSPKGELLEADLEEIYLYKFDKPSGWAMQRIYTADARIDEAVVARDGDVVLVPEGYHPVATAYGYDCYYLNFLAGSAQSLAATDDPAHSWAKETWTFTDPRIPMVTHGMEGRPAK